jgi:hypothetical protein
MDEPNKSISYSVYKLSLQGAFHILMLASRPPEYNNVDLLFKDKQKTVSV